MHTFLRRLIWALLLAGVWLWILGGCASAPPPPPRFVAPSTEPIARAHAAATKHLEAAAEKIKIIETECPGSKATIAALTTDLAGAKSELVTSENERVKLDTENKKIAAVGNWYADAYTAEQKQISELKQSRHGWVKRFWLASAILTAAGAWILRRPLMAAIRLAPSIGI